MKQSIKMILTLIVISSLSGTILAKVYEVTGSSIEAKQKEEVEEAIFTVLPEAKNYKKEIHDDVEIFKCFDKDHKICGIAFIAEGIGYQDIIKIMVGVSADLSEIKGIKILEDKETPGLGGRIKEDWFQNQFKGILTALELEAVKEKPKDANQIQAITGATVSSEAVVNLINQHIQKVKEALEK